MDDFTKGPRRSMNPASARRRPTVAILALAMLLAATVLLASTGGCGGSRRVPVSGVVTLDNKPVDGAAVMFVPVNGGQAATGVTDAQGRFSLITINDQGAAPGEYRVTVVKVKYQGAPASKGGVEDVEAFKSDNAEGESRLQEEHGLLKKYGNADDSGLTATITTQGGSFTFPLLSDEEK